jgi:hypothetical protein
MRVVHLARRIDAHLRIRAPRFWALRLHHLIGATACVSGLSVGLHLASRSELWRPLDGRGGAAATLVAASLASATWVYATVQSRRSLPAKYKLGWWLSPPTTMALLAVALVLPVLAAALSADAANRSIVDRNTLIADAEVLGEAYEQDGRIWIGVRRELAFDSRGKTQDTERFCQQARTYGLTLVAVAMKYISPRERAAMQVEYAAAFAACEQADLQWESAVTSVGFGLQPFAAAYNLSAYHISAPQQALLVVLSLELAMLGTAVTMIAQLLGWRRLGRIALGLLVLYYALQTIAPVALVDRQTLFETVVHITLWGATLAQVGWAIAVVSGRLRRRSTLRDHILCVVLAAPGFAAAVANSASGYSLEFFNRGWLMATFPLPEDQHLQAGYLIALSFLAITPLLHLFFEHYRTFRGG